MDQNIASEENLHQYPEIAFSFTFLRFLASGASTTCIGFIGLNDMVANGPLEIGILIHTDKAAVPAGNDEKSKNLSWDPW